MSQLSSPFIDRWIAAAVDPQPSPIKVIQVKQLWGHVSHGRSFEGTPLRFGGKTYARGLGTHADSEIQVLSTLPVQRFRAWVGVDRNPVTVLHTGRLCRLVFSIETSGQAVWTSSPLTIEDDPILVDVQLTNVNEFTLKVEALDNWYHYAHADWGDAQVDLAGRRAMWIGGTLEDQHLPVRDIFSFRYGGIDSDRLLTTWDRKAEAQSLGNGVLLHTRTYHDPHTGLTCIYELKEFAGQNAAEWVLRFRNDGNASTPILEDVLPLRLDWACPRVTTLHRSTGSHGHIDDFTYRVDPVEAETEFAMAAGGGRSSTDWLPYFALHGDGGGVTAAIGWSGQWSASVQRDGLDHIHLTAGMERTRLTLHPGEEIRTPSIALVFWDGEVIDGHNAFRRFVIEHHTPRAGGEIQTPPITAGNWGGMRTEDHLKAIASIKDIHPPYDYYWIDAGWFGTKESFAELESSGTWYGQAGNWSPNPVAHPNGMRPISDAVHALGMGFLLWCEPERAVRGTSLPDEHPDWFLGKPVEGYNALLDLGNPEARSWLTEFLSSWIEENNIDCLRQDFNCEPLPFWKLTDAEDRQGMSEIGHITGLYAVWDELRRRHPNLLIDNCASGGRRLDLELAGRSIPLWQSDYQCVPTCDPLGSQIQHLGLSYWLPLHGTSAHFRPGDTYNFRSALGAAMNFPPPGPVNGRENYPWEWHRRMMEDFRRARPLFYGDYYPLTAFSTTRDTWAAYQMHRGDLGKGMAVAFRREEAPFVSADLKLKSLNASARYRCENADTGDTWEVQGDQLMSGGLRVTIEHTRESVLVFYDEVR